MEGLRFDEELWRELISTRMPFGRYGPDRFPPAGLPLYELPYPYLSWFARKGFPRSRLGELLNIVYHIKADGGDAAFAPVRRQAILRGERVSLRARPRRHIRLAQDDEEC